jgi:hypothetical protein
MEKILNPKGVPRGNNCVITFLGERGRNAGEDYCVVQGNIFRRWQKEIHRVKAIRNHSGLEVQVLEDLLDFCACFG